MENMCGGYFPCSKLGLNYYHPTSPPPPGGPVACGLGLVDSKKVYRGFIMFVEGLQAVTPAPCGPVACGLGLVFCKSFMDLWRIGQKFLTVCRRFKAV